MSNLPKLRQQYPKLLKRAWEVSIEDGWMPIIEQLCKSIQHHVDTTGMKQVEVVQIKEKFGGLRFYTTHADDEVMAMINEAEHKADKTCERCGAEGEVRNSKPWIKTLCDKCDEAG